MNDLQHYHAIRVRYGCLSGSGTAIITLKSWRFSQSVKLRYDYSLDIITQAIQYLEEMGFNLIGYSSLDGTPDYIILTDTFKGIKRTTKLQTNKQTKVQR